MYYSNMACALGSSRYQIDTIDTGPIPEIFEKHLYMSPIQTAIAVFTVALAADVERCSGADDVRAAFHLFIFLEV